MPAGVPHRILAVDDVPSNLLTLRAILPEGEFELFEAAGADEAFRLLDEHAFDLVLLDVLLPEVDGYEIARRLKASPATTSLPVIFLTALKNEDEIVQGFEAGGVDFISKPFYQAELLVRLRTHLALKDKNEALERAAVALRQANEARDQFFSILAHDLKNPFAGFLSLLDQVQDHFSDLTTQDLEETIQTMGQTAQNVYRLLETLLDWGRAQTGTLLLEPQVQFVPFLFEEAIEPLEAAFRKKGIQLVLEASTGRAFADRYTVVAIVRNLLSNALKFTRAGGTVTLRSSEQVGTVELCVADTGVGIPRERVTHLFQLDQKISTPGTAKEPGTGLGLILCSEFARKNGGMLRVESEPGQGSTFTLTLPTP